MPRADRISRGQRGQGLVELVLTVPILLTVTFGILEFGTLLDRSLTLTGLSREGANMASRGASLDSVFLVTALNGQAIGLQDPGGVVVSRIEVQNGVPVVIDQIGSIGWIPLTRVGTLGMPATPLLSSGLSNGKIYHVVEVFSPYRPFTPLNALVNALVPDVLYDRTVF